MIRKGCGIFDEGTRKCLVCGETQEGPQCHIIRWSRIEILQAAAEVLGVPVVLSDYDSKLLLSTDNPTWRAYGTQFDPLRFLGQQLWIIDRLTMYHDYHIFYNNRNGKYGFETHQFGPFMNAIDPSATPARHSMNTYHQTLGHGLLLAAAKVNCMLNERPYPLNIAEDAFP